jgi:hypothetical protein
MTPSEVAIAAFHAYQAAQEAPPADAAADAGYDRDLLELVKVAPAAPEWFVSDIPYSIDHPGQLCDQATPEARKVWDIAYDTRVRERSAWRVDAQFVWPWYWARQVLAHRDHPRAQLPGGLDQIVMITAPAPHDPYRVPEPPAALAAGESPLAALAAAVRSALHSIDNLKASGPFDDEGPIDFGVCAALDELRRLQRNLGTPTTPPPAASTEGGAA